jgi:hypothetical protein
MFRLFTHPWLITITVRMWPVTPPPARRARLQVLRWMVVVALSQ